MTVKICYKCNEQKQETEFPKSKVHKSGFRNECKKCYTQYMIDYYNQNPQKKIAKNKMNSGHKPNWKRHGITEEQYNILFAKENGKCHGCKENEPTTIDHDHSCCQRSRSCGSCVRGLLCHNCNTALGLLKENKNYIASLLEYIK